jgi:hypothetical protein
MVPSSTTAGESLAAGTEGQLSTSSTAGYERGVFLPAMSRVIADLVFLQSEGLLASTVPPVNPPPAAMLTDLGLRYDIRE